MDVIEKYSIAYKNLSEGNHEFEFELNDLFFSSFEESPILSGEGVVKIELMKNNSMLSLMCEIDGQVGVECDRCLDMVMIPVEFEGELIVRFSDTENYYDGDIMWLSPGEDSVPLAQYIYESICLGLPYQRIHEEDEEGNPLCNAEMLAKFRIVSEQEFEQIATIEEEEVPLDNTQWSKLAALKAQMEEAEQEK